VSARYVFDCGCLQRRAAATPVLLLLLLTGCAGNLQYKSLLHDTQQLPPAHELADTAFFPQEIHQCGPAALATVLNSAGIKTTPEELVPLVYIPQRAGTLSIELASAVRTFGYLPYQLQQQLAELLDEVAHGRPVLVLQNLGLDWLPRWHYAVVIGYDLTQQQIVLRSGTNRRVVMKLSTFERTWRRGDYWALIIVKPGELPQRPREPEYLQAVVGLEQRQHWQAARAGYAAARDRWPHSLPASMGLGNSAYAMGDDLVAEHAYRETLRINGQYAPAYNNLAQIWADRRQWDKAEPLARRAVELGGTHIEEYKKTLNDILQKRAAAKN
jgi:tetratricopeptide (TPR) repeat protein